MDHWLTKRRAKGYDCANFAAEVLEVPVETLAGAISVRKGWRCLQGPQEGALALMRRNSGPPHVGIYISGGVLHLGERNAVFQSLPVIRRNFNKIRYYAKCLYND